MVTTVKLSPASGHYVPPLQVRGGQGELRIRGAAFLFHLAVGAAPCGRPHHPASGQPHGVAPTREPFLNTIRRNGRAGGLLRNIVKHGGFFNVGGEASCLSSS